jgi:hypothetical protein
MTENPIDLLDDLADQVAEEFEAYRPPDEFKDVSLVIDNNDSDRPTLIVHVERERTPIRWSMRSKPSYKNGVLELSVNGTRTQMSGC